MCTLGNGYFATRGAGEEAQADANHYPATDVELRGRPLEQMILRLHIFHLLQTVSLNTIALDVGVPARGWHGEAYRGHIFWDELFILSSYTLRFPEIARALLLYPYNRLDSARRAARACGYQGAMYPWQSASDGSEETQTLHLTLSSQGPGTPCAGTTQVFSLL